MGSWTSLLVAYLLGGVTFIPLVILAVFAHALYTFPVRDDFKPLESKDAVNSRRGSAGSETSKRRLYEPDTDGIVQSGDDTTALEDARREEESSPKGRTSRDLDVSAGYFAVCREYTPMGINAKPIERSTPLGSATVAAPSPSVYQTMYRSIFDRRSQAGGTLGEGGSMSQRPKKAGNVFYVVLRHGHLMLFDDDEQLEVRHVVSLAHHEVSIYSGGDVTPEGELFIKRNALCLSRRHDGPEIGPDSQLSKPFYLFSENCSAKEDFYFALLKNQEQTFGINMNIPRPQDFEMKSILSLVQKLHSSEEQKHTRWINALIGRIFLGIYKTRDLENFICEKITKKISRVKRPSFLTNISIRKIDVGDSAPFFTNMKLKDLTVEGECMVEADVKYTGNFRIEVAATAKIDLGTRFKAREVNLVLALMVKKVEGHVLFKIKAPPSNRIWFSFQTMPKMEMAIEPIVSTRQITYTVILRQIENRIKEVFAETLVQPFWDDLPFFRTEHKKWRGGIFEGDDAVPTDDAKQAVAQAGDVNTVHQLDENAETGVDQRPLEKSHSLPVLEPQTAATGLFGRKLGGSGASSVASASSTSVDARGSTSSTRSPKIINNMPEAVVGTDTSHADIFKPSTSPPDHASNYMASLSSRSQNGSPMATPIGSPSKKQSSIHSSSSSANEANDGIMEDDNATTPIAPGRRDTSSSTESMDASDSTETSKGQTGSIGRGFFLRREGTNATSASSSSDTLQKKNTLAAVTNAAVQARQWGWNAIQRQREARKNGAPGGQIDLSQPMGRGQPLPPPGTPLPGPNGMKMPPPAPLPKRKPVPPPFKPEPTDQDPKDPGAEASSAPPLPTRRRRGASHDVADEPEENILVVAAPDDSQPNTPADERNEYMRYSEEPELEEDMAALPDDMEETPPSQPHETFPTPSSNVEAIEDPIPTPVLESALQPDEVPAYSSSMHVEDDANPLPESPSLDSPIVAMPVTDAADDDDDDDYSGWMEDDEHNEAVAHERKDTLPAETAGTHNAS